MADKFDQIFDCIKGDYSNYTKDTVRKASEFLGIAENQPIDIPRMRIAMTRLHRLEMDGQEDVVRLIRVIAIIMGNQVDIPHPPEPPRRYKHVGGWFGRDDCRINDRELTQFDGQDGRIVDLKEIHNSLRRTGPKTPEEFFANFMTMLLVRAFAGETWKDLSHTGRPRDLHFVDRVQIYDFIEATLRSNGEMPVDFKEYPERIENFIKKFRRIAKKIQARRDGNHEGIRNLEDEVPEN